MLDKRSRMEEVYHDKGEQNIGRRILLQVYTIQISIKCQDCSDVPSREAHEVRLDASVIRRRESASHRDLLN